MRSSCVADPENQGSASVEVGHTLPDGPVREYGAVTISDRPQTDPGGRVAPSLHSVCARLEDLTPGARVRGVLVNVPVTVIDVAWHGGNASR